jgi:hypothetical protein
MNPQDREELRIHLSIALVMLPKPVRLGLGERLTSKKDPAVDAIVEVLIAAVERNFEITVKPHSAVQPPLHY